MPRRYILFKRPICSESADHTNDGLLMQDEEDRISVLLFPAFSRTELHNILKQSTLNVEDIPIKVFFTVGRGSVHRKNRQITTYTYNDSLFRILFFSNISKMCMCGCMDFLYHRAKLMTSLGTRFCVIPQCQRRGVLLHDNTNASKTRLLIIKSLNIKEEHQKPDHP